MADSKRDLNMQLFARNAGTTMTYPAGSIIFKEGDEGNCIYVVQSGTIEIMNDEKVSDTCGANDALGFMTVIDGGRHTATARVREAAELSVIDERKFRFMVDEVPNFAYYIMKAMASRIRGMRKAV